jgi:hypothetical protein
VTYKLLADAVVLIHLLWILFLFVGAVWGRKSKAVRIIPLGGLAFALISEIMDWICPLTHLEFWLRSRHDPTLSYAGSFIVHYVEELIYIDMSRTAVFICTILLAAFNIWMYTKKTEQDPKNNLGA